MNNVYGEIISILIKENINTWNSYISHNFVQQLADGTLQNIQFLKYLKQDYIFLIHFARAWALATVKAENLEEMTFTSSIMNSLIEDEMELHRKICAREGIGKIELENTIEEPENLAYTRYVLEIGFSGDFLDLIIALSPCVIGYGIIGNKLKKIAKSDKYIEWINTYSSQDYQNLCISVAKFIDDSVVRRLGVNYQDTGKWNQLIWNFHKATKLETKFWDMGLNE